MNRTIERASTVLAWRRWMAALLWIASCLFAPFAFAQDVLPVPALTARVIDQTGTLSAAQVAALDAKLANIETARGSQLVVLMVPTTLPEDIAAYAQRVGDTWKIGRRDVGDGLIIVVAKNDRTVRIEVAKTLEGAVPDLAARRIITEQITPAFKQGDFAGGLSAAIDRLDARIGGENLPAPAPAPAGSRRSSERSQPGFDLNDLAIFLFVGAPIIGAVLTGMLGRKLGSLGTGVAVGGIGWFLTASLLTALGAGLLALVLVGVLGLGTSRGRGLGGGGPVIWGGGGGFGGRGGGGFGGGFGGGGGGFGSGGGGDFGGGGASGKW